MRLLESLARLMQWHLVIAKVPIPSESEKITKVKAKGKLIHLVILIKRTKHGVKSEANVPERRTE